MARTILCDSHEQSAHLLMHLITDASMQFLTLEWHQCVDMFEVEVKRTLSLSLFQSSVS
jgi:hypothetical protein